MADKDLKAVAILPAEAKLYVSLMKKLQERIRVLQLIGSLDRGGAEMVVVNLCNHIDSDKYEVRIATLMDTVPLFEKIDSSLEIKIETCGMSRGRVHFGQQISSLIRLRKIIRTFKPHIIHSHLFSTYAPLQWLGSLGVGSEHVFTLHNTGMHYEREDKAGRLLRMFEVITIRLCRAEVVGVSQAVTEKTGLQALKLNPERLRTIYNGIDVTNYNPESVGILTNEELGCNPDDLKVIYIARFHEQKNHIGLMEIWKAVIENVPAAKLLLVGQGPLRASVQERAKALDIYDTIKWMGYRDDVNRLLVSSDLAVFPSLFEGFSIAILEQMASGLPVVYSKIPPFEEAMADCGGGVCVEIKDIDGWCNSIVKLLKDAELRKKMGVLGRKRVVDNFSIQKQACEHEDLYYSLVLEKTGKQLQR